MFETLEKLLISRDIEKKIISELEKAGMKMNIHNLFVRSIIIGAILSVIGIIFSKSLMQDYSAPVIVLMLIFLFFLFTILGAILVWVSVFIMITLKKFRRRNSVEEVLSDYLQLVAANINAGMTIDQALWYAVRPRFDVLAKEIETVAKKTMGGTELDQALKEFADKYDSALLKRSINLLIEGMQGGGQTAELITKISWNLKETQIMRKEIAADVATYAIFISFATLGAAPFLFALSYRLIIIMKEITSSIDLSDATSAGAGIGMGGTQLPISNLSVGIDVGDFRIFAILCLLVSSIFSSMIVSIIKKGSIKAGAKSIPIYMITTVALFFILSMILTSFFEGMF